MLCPSGVHHECEEFVKVCPRNKFQEWSPKGYENHKYSFQFEWVYFQEQEDFRDKIVLSISFGFTVKNAIRLSEDVY